MSFLAPIIALVVEVLKALNLWQTGAARETDRQAGADALAAATNADTVEIADAQLANDRASRTLDSIADRLQHDAEGVGAGGDESLAGGALRPADKLDGGRKA